MKLVKVFAIGTALLASPCFSTGLTGPTTEAVARAISQAVRIGAVEGEAAAISSLNAALPAGAAAAVAPFVKSIASSGSFATEAQIDAAIEANAAANGSMESLADYLYQAAFSNTRAADQTYGKVVFERPEVTRLQVAEVVSLAGDFAAEEDAAWAYELESCDTPECNRARTFLTQQVRTVLENAGFGVKIAELPMVYQTLIRIARDTNGALSESGKELLSKIFREDSLLESKLAAYATAPGGIRESKVAACLLGA